LKQEILILACACAALAAAQTGGGYQGPGVLTRGAGNVGQRGGEQVDLRFFASISSTYDTGLQPIALDSKGQLAQINGIYGAEASLGVYGTHNWKTATLGIDYTGNYHAYSGASYFDGSDQSLALGYSVRATKRFSIDMREVAGTASRGLGTYYSAIPGDQVNLPTSLLFDNRTYYTQSGMDFIYQESARTVFSAGGDGFLVRRQSAALTGLNGYDLHGSVEHRQTKNTTIGVNYQYSHYDFPRVFGEADVQVLQGTYATRLSRRWTLSLAGGVARTEVRGLEQVATDPVVAALTGITSVVRTFYRINKLPSVNATLGANFHRSSLTFTYQRGVNSGNGLYLTSRTESASAGLSYTASRRMSLSLSGGYSTLGGLSQGLSSYSQWNAGAAANYNLGRGFQATARYDARQTDLDTYLYHRLGYRVSLGLTFSPGSIPISFW
jgi:hypothetical protein